MKTVNFTKMHGAGNDYIYVDCFAEAVTNPAKLAVKLSDRHFGVGGDGLVLICPSRTCDAKMRMFNADGSEGKMCGNAVRCVAKYLYESGRARKATLNIETLSGVKRISLDVKDGEVRAASVSMGRADFSPSAISIQSEREIIGESVKFSCGEYYVTCLSVGNPHCVTFVEDVDGFDVQGIGEAIERDSLFPERVNVEFAEQIAPNALKMRVWERGSGETLACGTGACALCAAAVRLGLCDADKEITVTLRGGELRIKVAENDIVMTGPAVTVFKGFVGIE